MALSTLVLRLTHTGVDKDNNPFSGSVFIPDLETGLEYQGRKSAVYVPAGGSITIPIANRVAFSMYSGAIKQFVEDGLLTAETLVDSGGSTSSFSGISSPLVGVGVFDESVTITSGNGTTLTMPATVKAGKKYLIEHRFNFTTLMNEPVACTIRFGEATAASYNISSGGFNNVSPWYKTYEATTNANVISLRLDSGTNAEVFGIDGTNKINGLFIYEIA